jgi:antitoxin (DNA-binding transcriptional repressor) of toxin-antitoxin stability system
VEITEHGKPVAVLLDYQTYQDLLRKTAPAASIESLKGSVTILDAIEQARREINEEFQRSVERRSRLL